MSKNDNYSKFSYDNLHGTTVILFGSYAFGEDNINSDIDLAVIGAKKKDIDMDKFEKMMERKININYFESFRKIDKHLLNNLLNGIIIKGAVDL